MNHMNGIAALAVILLMLSFSGAAFGSSRHVLIVCFSLWGNAEYSEDIDATSSASVLLDGGRFGTTEYIARMIQKNIGGDLYLIHTLKPYPAEFQAVVDQHLRESQAGFLPELQDNGPDLSRYDTVFIGYPIWGMKVPQAVQSFLNGQDFSGKTVVPFCTHDGYGAGGTFQNIVREDKAKILDGLAVEAKNASTAGTTVSAWLKKIGIIL